MTLRQGFDINQGADWSYTFTHRNAAGSAVDLTGYTARMAIKLGLFSVQNAFLSTGADAIGGSIVLGGVLGTVVLAMTAVQTDSLFESNGFLNWFWASPAALYSPRIDFMYDLELVSGAGAVTRALEGFLTLHRSVTS